MSIFRKLSCISTSLTKRNAVSMGFLLLIAFLFRCINIGKAELWQDEMIFVNILSTHTENAWTTFLRYWNYLISMGQMPLAGVVQNIYIHFLDSIGVVDSVSHPGLMRIPMLILGTLAVGGVYSAARRLFVPSTAFLAGLLMAATLYPVYYSREAYCYAYVLFFSSWGVAAWLRSYQEGGLKSFLIALFCFTGLGLSNLGAQVVLASWSATAGLFWGYMWLRKNTGKCKPFPFAVVLAPTLAFLICSPYLLHFFNKNTAHIGAMSDQSLFLIINDILNRLCLGENGLFPLVAWVFFCLGVFGLFRQENPDAPQGRGLLVLATLGSMLLLSFATLRSQYISARYFSPIVPLLLLVFAQGVRSLAKIIAWLLRLRSGRSVYICQTAIALLFVLSHLVFFLPKYWSLRSKDEPFGWVATWLNNNLAPGSLYQLESSYQYRFLGGYYKTPNLIPLAPYVQGSGPDELRKLQEIQQDVCLRFPEAVFITLGHPGWDHPDRPWEWPSQHFRQQITLRNDALLDLIQTGMFPAIPYATLDDHRYCFNIYFNTPEDRKSLARKGSGVLFDYPGWNIQSQPVNPVQVLYFRSSPGPRATIDMVNVADKDIVGSLALNIGVSGKPTSETKFKLVFDKEILYESQPQVGKLFKINTHPFALPSGRHKIELIRESPSPGDGFILWEANWIIQ